MTQWIKVEKTNSSSGRQPRTTFAISRSKRNPDSAAKLICPVAHVTADKCDIFVNKPGTMVRIQMTEAGAFSIQKTKGSGHTRTVTIPREVVEKLPIGLTETKVEVDAEEGFLTIELKQFTAALKAQAETPAETPAEAPAKPKTPAKGKTAKPKAEPAAEPAGESATQDDPAAQPADSADDIL